MQIQHDYIRKDPVSLRDKPQRESHKLYWLSYLSHVTADTTKRANNGTPISLTAEAR